MGPTASQKVAGLLGAVLVAVGLLGFLGHGGFGTDPLERGSFLGLDVNGWHNLVHVASGLLLLAGSARRSFARAAWRLFLGAYLVVLVWGLIDGDDVFGLIPVDGADHVLHGVLLLVAIWGTRAAKERRDTILQERASVARPEGPAVVGPGSGHVGGHRRPVARIDARLPPRG